MTITMAIRVIMIIKLKSSTSCEVLVGAGHLLLPRVSYFFRSNHQTTAEKSGYREGYLKISKQCIIVIAR